MKTVILFISILALCPIIVGASGLSYSDNQVFSHGYTDMRQCGPLMFADYPCARLKSRRIMETSYRSLYDLKELTENEVSVGFRLRKFTIGGAVSSFGQADYFHQFGLAIAAQYRYGNALFGASSVYQRLSFNQSYNAISHVSAIVGFSYAYRNLFIFGVGRNVNQPESYSGGRRLKPEGELGLSYRSVSGLDSQAKALFIRNHKPTAQVSQSFPLYASFSVNWVLVLSPVRFGGGFHLEKSHVGFDYAFSHHPVLGMTHTITISIF